MSFWNNDDQDKARREADEKRKKERERLDKKKRDEHTAKIKKRKEKEKQDKKRQAWEEKKKKLREEGDGANQFLGKDKDDSSPMGGAPTQKKIPKLNRGPMFGGGGGVSSLGNYKKDGDKGKAGQKGGKAGKAQNGQERTSLRGAAQPNIPRLKRPY